MPYALFALLLLISACQTAPTGQSDGLDLAYAKALKQSQKPKASAIYTKLEAIRRDNPNLQWDAEGRVLLAGLTSWDAYHDQAGKQIIMGRPFGVVPVHSLRDYVEQARQAKRFSSQRLLQKMGKAPGAQAYWVLELWIHPKDLFRPCPDASIADSSCQLDFPDTASAEHRTWFKEQLKKTKKYSLLWGRLGYTYDWGNLDNPIGFSEYVVYQRSEMKLETVVPLADYRKE